MNFSEQIIDVIDSLCQKFGIVVDWTSQNVVPRLEEFAEGYIAYERATSYVWIVVVSVVAAASIYVTAKSMLADKKKNGGLDDSLAWLVFSVPATATAIFVTVKQVIDIIACKYIPEKIIIDAVTKLLEQK